MVKENCHVLFVSVWELYHHVYPNHHGHKQNLEVCQGLSQRTSLRLHPVAGNKNDLIDHLNAECFHTHQDYHRLKEVDSFLLLGMVKPLCFDSNETHHPSRICFASTCALERYPSWETSSRHSSNETSNTKANINYIEMQIWKMYMIHMI